MTDDNIALKTRAGPNASAVLAGDDRPALPRRLKDFIRVRITDDAERQ
jgi:hypothetical protein